METVLPCDETYLNQQKCSLEKALRIGENA